MRNGHTEAVGEPVPEKENWEEFGFEPADAPGWKALGFGPFEAAMAHGDGYTPMFATHYTRQLQKTAASWTRVGLGSPEGLRWHLAGFAPKEAIRWRKHGVDVEAARTLRSGHGRVADRADQVKSKID
jgi:hypothetical protein